MPGDSRSNHFQLHLYQSQGEATHIPPRPPTGWAVYCEALPMRWRERVLTFFRLSWRPYKVTMIPGNDGWSLFPVSGSNAIYMATERVP